MKTFSLLRNTTFSFLSGLDYKKLISDDFPLKVLEPVMTNANVHVLAKLANKIPTKVN